MPCVAGKYPEADPAIWLRFGSGPNVDPIFARRMAAYARDVLKCVWDILVGVRTEAEQTVLYARYQAYLKAYKAWELGGKVGPEPKPVNPAAAPNTSWHQYREAVDQRNYKLYPSVVADFQRPPAQQAMRKYGICIPMWAGSAGYHEGWHIQPEETLDYSGDKAAFMTAGGDTVLKAGDNNPRVGSWQFGLEEVGYWPAGTPHNTNFGPTTAAQTNAFKKSRGLPEDGQVDEATWAAMTDALRAVKAAQTKKLTADLTAATSKISAAKTALT